MTKEERRKVHTGGANFSPQLPVRPQYPSFMFWLWRVLVRYTRAPILMAGAAHLLKPRFDSMIASLTVRRGYSERTVFALIAVVVHSGMYVLWNGAFAAMEKLQIGEQYRLAGKQSQIAKPELVQRTLKEASLGHAAGPLIFYSIGFPAFKFFGMPDMAAALPGFAETYMAFVVAHLLNDWGFYFAHRSFHAASIYKNFHKQHHSWINTRGVSAEFAHHVEEVFANYLPTLGGMMFFGRHPLLAYVWFVYRLSETYEAHSNYYFGNTLLAKVGLTHSSASAFHSAHHSINAGNFGCFVTDWVGGTMDQWVANGLEDGYVKERLGKVMLE